MQDMLLECYQTMNLFDADQNILVLLLKNIGGFLMTVLVRALHVIHQIFAFLLKPLKT